MRIDPALTLVILLAIGIVAGLIFDRIAGPGWLTRQIAGSTRGMATSSLVGIAGAFIGYHAVALAAPRQRGVHRRDCGRGHRAVDLAHDALSARHPDEKKKPGGLRRALLMLRKPLRSDQDS